MSGTLYHAKDFFKREYIANDGRLHYELIAIDGESCILSHATWREMKCSCKAYSIPFECWPEFLEIDLGIDAPLSAIRAKQEAFARQLLSLPKQATDENENLRKLVGWIQQGEIVFFCGN